METSEHKKQFIKTELEWFEKYLLENLVKALKQKDIGITEELMQSLEGRVKAAVDNSDGEFDLSFLSRGRFVDMGAGRGYRKGIYEQHNRKNKVYLALDAKQTIKRRPKKWYSRTAYGIIDRLLMRLVSNYEEEIINSVKSIAK